MAVLIHTADLHLGRMLYGERLLSDQAASWTSSRPPSRRIRRCAPDCRRRLRPRGSPEGVELLDEFLTAVVRDLDVPVVLIPGNHDSADRIGFGSRLLDDRLHIAADMTGRTSRWSSKTTTGPSRSMASPTSSLPG